MPALTEQAAADTPQPVEAREEAPTGVAENESPAVQVEPTVAPVVVKPTIRRSTTPEYPPADRRAGNQGRVVLECYVDESGRAGEVRIAESSGHETLDAAAVREVQQNWRFVPGTKDGQPEGMWTTFSLTFSLAQ
jgi:protein TonB